MDSSLVARLLVGEPDGEAVFTSYVERANVKSARLQLLSVPVQLFHLRCHEEALRTLRVRSARD